MEPQKKIPNQPRPPQPSTAQPWLPQFGIAEMMLAMLIFCVMAAAGSYFWSAAQNGRGRAVFVIFTLASPVALVLVLSAYVSLKRWLRGR